MLENGVFCRGVRRHARSVPRDRPQTRRVWPDLDCVGARRVCLSAVHSRSCGLAGSSGARCPRVSDGRESGAAASAGWETRAPVGRRPAPTRGSGIPVEPTCPPGHRHDRHTGHPAALASPVGRPEVDIRENELEPSRSLEGDPAPGRADGGRESHVGLHAHPRGAEESRPPRRPLNDCPNFEGARCAARARPSDVVADLPPSALGRHRGRRLLHHGGLDLARARDVLHRLRDRSGLSARPGARIVTTPGRGVHAPGRAESHARGRVVTPRIDLRSRWKMDGRSSRTAA